MKRYLREIIGNYLILNSAPPPIPYSVVYLLVTPMFSSFAFLHLRSNVIAYFLPFFNVFIYLLVLFLTN